MDHPHLFLCVITTCGVYPALHQTSHYDSTFVEFLPCHSHFSDPSSLVFSYMHFYDDDDDDDDDYYHYYY